MINVRQKKAVTPRTSTGVDNDALTISMRDIKHLFQSVIILFKFSVGVPFAFRVTRANMDILNRWYSTQLRTVESVYNDVSFCDTSSIASYIFLYQIIPYC